LKLNAFQRQISVLILIKRILRWIAGKALDSFQKIGVLGSTHWRDKL